MSENAAIAAKIQETFRSKMEEEITALAEAFGPKTARIQSMAASKVLDSMRKTYPEVVFMAHEISLWDIMGFRQKLFWLLSFGITISKEAREKLADKMIIDYMSRGSMPPFWANPNPKEVKIVELRIGMDKKPRNIDGSNLCRE